MSSKRNIVVVEACSGGFNYIADILARGYQPVILEIYVGNEPEMAAIVDEMHQSVYRNLPKKIPVIKGDKDYANTLATVKKLNPVLIVPGMEGGVELAFRLSEDLGLRCNPYANIAQYTRKDAMHQRLKESGLRYIRGKMVSSEKDVADFMEKIGKNHVVVKPTRSASSMDVKLCSGLDEAVEGMQTIMRDQRFADSENLALIQERIFGKEFIVNTVSRNGRHALLSVYEYEKTPTADGINLYKSDHTVMTINHETETLIQYAFDVLDGLDFRNGLVHGEYMIDEEGPVLMEVNCRPMGTALSPVFQDMVFGQHETAAALDALLSQEAFDKIAARSYQPRKTMMNYYINASDKMTVTAIPLKEKVRQLKTYYSDTLPDISDSVTFEKTLDFESKIGMIRLLGDEQDVLADYEWLDRMLTEKFDECFESALV